MAIGRLVVVAGPDLGQSFDLPLRGGYIGRADDGVVVLSDGSVSRQHARLEYRSDQLVLVALEPGPRTTANGNIVTTHVLRDGDEVTFGASRLTYEALVEVAAARRPNQQVTLEVGSRQLLALGGPEASGHGDGRAQRYLAALAQLGDGLAGVVGADAVARLACEAARVALGGDRALVRTGTSAKTLLAASVLANDPDGENLIISAALARKVIADGTVLTLAAGGDAGERAAIVVPVPGPMPALLWIDRRQSAHSWDSLDAMAAAVIANLVGAALVGASARDELARGKAAAEDRLAQHTGNAGFIGASPATLRMLDFVERVAPSDATVLLGGESGSGKEMVAQAIHAASRRSAGPLVAVNCAALTESLIESELFGHERGAFTGATERKAGRFELADKGTLFLDEVGELPMNLQTKFLRVLEDRRVERIGAARPIDVDVRVIAASNLDLAEQVRLGKFREDLFYRLSVISEVVPPLRERADDVALLAEHFLSRFRSGASRRIRGFAPEALAKLVAHTWPGNVRELRNTVERAVVLGQHEWIEASDLPATIIGPRTPPVAAGVSPVPSDVGSSDEPRSLRDLERDGIVAALASTAGNKVRAAAVLGIDRSTLYKKLKDYGLE